MNSVFNAIRVAVNVILHSVRTNTLCWAAIALTAVILIVRGIKGKKKEENQDSNYSMEGMSLGMCFGLVLGTALGDNLGVGISLGAIAGLVIGMCISKKTGDGDK